MFDNETRNTSTSWSPAMEVARRGWWICWTATWSRKYFDLKVGSGRKRPCREQDQVRSFLGNLVRKLMGFVIVFHQHADLMLSFPGVKSYNSICGEHEHRAIQAIDWCFHSYQQGAMTRGKYRFFSFIPGREGLASSSSIDVLHTLINGCTNTSIFPGWWFGTCFMFPNSWDDTPIWLIFFRGVETTNQFPSLDLTVVLFCKKWESTQNPVAYHHHVFCLKSQWSSHDIAPCSHHGHYIPIVAPCGIPW